MKATITDVDNDELLVMLLSEDQALKLEKPNIKELKPKYFDNNWDTIGNNDDSISDMKNSDDKTDKIIIEPAPMFKKVGRFSEEISNRYFT
jgi:hypothetical protein